MQSGRRSRAPATAAGLTRISDISTAVPLTDPLDGTAIAALDAEQQAEIVSALTERNFHLAKQITACTKWANAGTKSSESSEDDLLKLMKTIQTDPTQPLEQQYEDFGLWRDVHKTTQKLLARTERTLREQKRQLQPEETTTSTEQPMDEDQDVPTVRDIVVKEYGDEIDRLRHDSRFNPLCIPILINTLDMASELLTEEEKQLLA
eukprot:m.173080 g.173080  ORF g.173080 m.173080 type:complete len:206 (-) comp16524_c0_seq1:3564-4181(-)